MSALWDKKRSLPLFVLIGVVTAFFVASQKKPMEREVVKDVGRKVSVVEVKRRLVVPRVIGYGTVTPATEIQLSAEVEGRITYIHPRLKAGESLPAETLLLKIDKADYESKLSKSKSQLQQARTQLKELVVEEASIKQSLVLAKDKKELAKKELERKKSLLDRRLVSQSEIDREEQSLLALKQDEQSRLRELDVMPQRKDTQRSEIERLKAQVKEAERDIERTNIYMPLRGRIAEVTTEKNQFIGRGGLLVKIQGVSQIEVSTHITLRQMRRLVLGMFRGEYTELNALPGVKDLPQLNASLRLAEKGFEQTWNGIVTRVGSELSAQTRTLDVVVTVDNPNQKIVPGQRPPLLRGMYMEVTITAPPLKAFVVPRYTLHEGQIFVLDNEHKLVKRKVKVDFYNGELAVIQDGLNEGELVVLTDLVPAVEGALYQPRVSQEVESWIKTLALGTIVDVKASEVASPNRSENIPVNSSVIGSEENLKSSGKEQQ